MPILIEGNRDFSTQTAAKGWSGNGSLSNPFFIDGLEIGPAESNLIVIRNTDVHFLISNCLLKGGWTGITFNNVTNGKLTGNKVDNNSGNGIYLWNSWNCTLSVNTVTSNNGEGILLENSGDNTLSANTVSSNRRTGIELIFSGKCFLSANTVTNNGEAGIWLGGSENCTLSANTVSSNSGNGIYLWICTSCTFFTNTVSSNSGNGIYFWNSGDCFLSVNTISSNSDYGISVSLGSDNNVVQNNNFLGNNPNGSQALDDGRWNIFKLNFWDDWVSSNADADGDGFIDESYAIAGKANNQDSSPRAFPYPPKGSYWWENPAVLIITGILLLLSAGILFRLKHKNK